MSLPSEVIVKFIGCEGEVDALLELAESPVIGLDCEWRPNLTKFIKTDTAIMQISNASTVFVIVLIALKNSERLADVLKRVFLDEAVLKVGLALRGDLTRIQNSFGEEQSFAEKMVRYLDLGLLHQDFIEFQEAP